MYIVVAKLVANEDNLNE